MWNKLCCPSLMNFPLVMQILGKDKKRDHAGSTVRDKLKLEEGIMADYK